jgi:peptidoglycan/LPS O-acetylase OafA/YrhL
MTTVRPSIMTLVPPAGGPRLLFIDGLRGLAATWVVLYHAHAGGHIPDLDRVIPSFLYEPLFRSGDCGVAIFFALSGFVIAHSLRRHVIDGRFFGGFTLRRALRLDPPYFVSLALLLSFSALSAHIKHEPYAFPTIDRLIAHLFYLHNLLGYEPISLIYWTLCLEIQFYLVYCAAQGITQRLLPKLGEDAALAVVFGPLGLVGLLYGASVVEWLPVFGLFFSHWHGFFLGVLAHWTWTRRTPARLFWSFASVILLSSFISADGKLGPVTAHQRFALVAALTAALLLLAGSWNKYTHWLSSPAWQLLGRFSYSLYLTHNVVTGAAFFVIYRLMGKNLISELLALPLVLMLCIAASAVFWWLFERPCLALSQRISLAAKPLVATAPATIPSDRPQTGLIVGASNGAS